MSDQTSGPQADEVPAAEVELDRKVQELLDSIAYIRAWLDRQREKHLMASDQTSEPEKWDAEKALDDLLVYMNGHGLKRWSPDVPGTYTFFPDGSGLTIEIRMGLPSGAGRRRKSEGSDRVRNAIVRDLLDD